MLFGITSSRIARSRPLHRLLALAILMLIGAGPAPAAESGPLKILALGDSLTSGYGLPQDQGFVPQLQKALAAAGIRAQVINAGVAGDTSAGGLARLDWALADDPAVVIVELGANDALRGLDPAVTRAALSDILTRLKARNIAVMLCGMMAPPNYGRDYAERFNTIYPDLAKSFGVPLYPFFLDGVAADAKLNQADGIHPTPQGVDIIVRNMMPTVEAFLGPLRGQQP
jgi:acyl-CoA thioesterase I